VPAGDRVSRWGNHGYLKDIGATAARYGEGVAQRVRSLAGGQADGVFDPHPRCPNFLWANVKQIVSSSLEISGCRAIRTADEVDGSGT
jgi:hypothetical protein